MRLTADPAFPRRTADAQGLAGLIRASSGSGVARQAALLRLHRLPPALARASSAAVPRGGGAAAGRRTGARLRSAGRLAGGDLARRRGRGPGGGRAPDRPIAGGRAGGRDRGRPVAGLLRPAARRRRPARRGRGDRRRRAAAGNARIERSAVGSRRAGAAGRHPGASPRRRLRAPPAGLAKRGGRRDAGLGEALPVGRRHRRQPGAGPRPAARSLAVPPPHAPAGPADAGAAVPPGGAARRRALRPAPQRVLTCSGRSSCASTPRCPPPSTARWRWA